MRLEKTFPVSGVLSILFAVIAIAIMTLQLLTPPILGIADNTDFRRISFQVGITPAASPATLFKYVDLRFPFSMPQRFEYASSELLFCKVARTMNRVFFSKEVFDIRFLGATHLTVYAIALFLFALAIRLRWAKKLIFLALCLFMLVDDRITSYFNSFYSEGASVVFLMLTLAAMLLLGIKSPSRWRCWVNILSFLLFSILLGFSKIQNLIMLLPLWVFGICVALRFLKSPASRRGWAIATCVLMIGGLWLGVASRAYAYTKGNHIRIILGNEIKKHSKNYGKDLRELHATENDISRVTLVRIGLFYANHPKRYWNLLKRRAAQTFQSIPYGSYTRTESRWPWEQSAKFTVWWRFKADYYPKKLWFIFGTLAVSAFLGVYNYFTAHAHRQSHTGLVTATLSAMAACAFFIAATFEAEGMEKNFFLFNVLFDLVTVFSISLACMSFKSVRAFLHH